MINKCITIQSAPRTLHQSPFNIYFCRHIYLMPPVAFATSTNAPSISSFADNYKVDRPISTADILSIVYIPNPRA